METKLTNMLREKERNGMDLTEAKESWSSNPHIRQNRP